jgi:CRP/FNR family transcriptional regulator
MYSPLFDHIRKYVSLDAAEAEDLTACLHHRTLKKKEFLFSESQLCSANYFVLQGCLRLFFTDESGTEHIIQFGLENWWITDQQSLDWQQPSHFNLQAIEASSVAILDRAHLATTFPSLLDRIPSLDRYFRLIAQRAFAASQQHRYFVHNLTGEERYHQFVNAFPEFIQRIPQYMVASYLGFTPEFISKIRGRK